MIVSTIAVALENHAEPVSVTGELRNFFDNRDGTGWMFFSLVDSNRMVRCVVAPEVAKGIEVTLSEGSRVKIRGRFWVYEKDARIELLVDSIEKLGSHVKKLVEHEIIERLRSEGLLAKARMRSFPDGPPPSRIAIIAPANSLAPMDIRTAATGTGGLTFVIRAMEHNSPEVLIAEIKQCEKHSDELDAIIITRGGGDDLSLYDDETVLRAVIDCKIPVVSAIGHSSDNTLLDFVSVNNLPTPSVAGSWLKELHQKSRQRKSIERKQVVTLAVVALLVIFITIILWGTGYFSG